jgi:hypothetical protein
VLDARRRPADEHAVRDRGCARRRLDRAHPAEPCAFDARAGEAHDGSLAPDPWFPSQPARRLELRNMTPNDTLIEIKPDLNRWDR